MLKLFKAKVHVTGHYIIEDPNCPASWRGSGCYDINVDTWLDTEVEVWARSKDGAEKLIEEYEYASGYTIEIDDVDFAVEFVRDMDDRDDEEEGVVEPVIINWKEHEFDSQKGRRYHASHRLR